MRQIIKMLSAVLLILAVIAAVTLILTKYMDVFSRSYYMFRKSFVKQPGEPSPAEACCYEEE